LLFGRDSDNILDATGGFPDETENQERRNSGSENLDREKKNTMPIL
jgi:hypothetical protein